MPQDWFWHKHLNAKFWNNFLEVFYQKSQLPLLNGPDVFFSNAVKGRYFIYTDVLIVAV